MEFIYGGAALTLLIWVYVDWLDHEQRQAPGDRSIPARLLIATWEAVRRPLDRALAKAVRPR
ncbi:hypothetical protein [Nocardiopsis suaedae]|uniref:Uncharacterized protein n=1 Tax=Nocardiopsis suaedae TaxID=3018444 RepID=A0ABT4TLZ1_9ACTN|nr:hypothetical protein [Nocardiopsis suaedae]MDA2805719.1 hypothetical protein [Nocardiopsis suaedae]